MLQSIPDEDGQLSAFNAQTAPEIVSKIVVPVEDGPLGPTATIPDAHLLFNADFKRAGLDLILRGDDGKSVVVHDYFASDQHAKLLSPEGAALAPEVVAALAGPQAPGEYAQATAGNVSAEAIGRVVKFDGNATIVRNGVAVALNAGDAVLKGDVLQTGSGKLAVTFNDGSTLNLTAQSRLVVNEFVYDPQGSKNSEFLSLVQGSLTFISGEVAHTGDMRIGTPVATMGIRGTVGGVTEANDGTVSYYIVQSATGADLIDNSGTVFAQVLENGPMIVVRAINSLNVLATEVQKSPGELAIELAALQDIVGIKSIGDQIIRQFFQSDPNNPQSTDHPHTQIQIDLPNNLAELTHDHGTNPVTFTATVHLTTIDPNFSNINFSDQILEQVTITLPAGTTLPAAPVITTTAPAQDKASSIDIVGTAEANSTVTLYNGADAVGTVVADGSGNWHVNGIALSDGADYNFQATATNAAGNTSPASNALAFHDDQTPPAANINLAAITADNVINAAEAGGTVAVAGTVGGDVQVGDTVTLTVNGIATTGLVQAGGTFSILVAGSDLAADSNVHASVITSDAAGNSTTATADRGYTVDTTVAAPVIISFADNSGSTLDHITNDTTPTLTITAEASSTVEVFKDGVAVGTATETATPGTFTFTSATLAHGSYDFTAKATDAAGNLSDVSADFMVAIDTPPVLTLGHSENVQDQFNSAAYNLNTGSVNWATNWIEMNDGSSNQATTGEILVANDPTVLSGNLRLKLSDLDSEVGPPDTVERTANLSTATSAILTFDYRRDIPNVDAFGEFYVLISTDGTNFTQIAAIGGGTFVDDHYLTASFDISAYISPTTTIRFSAGDEIINGDVIYIDNVGIAYIDGTYVENGAGVAIAGTGSLITDPDSTNIESATITLTNARPGDSLTVSSLAALTALGISVGSSDASHIDLTGSASKANYAAALQLIVFSNSSDNPDTTDRSITVVVNDGTAESNTATTTIHVTAVNDAPVVANAIHDQSSPEHALWSFQVPANAFSDVDNATLTYTATLGSDAALPSWLSFNAATGTFSGTPPQNFNGQIDLKVTASDGSLSVSDTFALNVTPVNDAPVVANAIHDQSSPEDALWSFQVPANAFSDVDNATLTYTATLGSDAALPSWLSFNAATGTFSGTPPQDFNGHIDLKVTASDGSLSATDTFTLNVTPVNDAPTIDLAPIITEVPIPNPLPLGADTAALEEIAPAMSKDGRWVVFFSDEQVPNGGGNNDKGDVYLYDRLTGVTKVLTDDAHIPLASRPQDGTPEHYSGFSINGDGSTVVFKGEHEVPDPNFPNGQRDVSHIYIYDRTSDSVRLLTNPVTHVPYAVNDEARIAGGNLIVFSSMDFGNDTGPPIRHIYVTDLAGHIQTDITPGTVGITEPTDPNDPLFNRQTNFQQPDISGNGRYLTFWTVANTFDPNTNTATPAGDATLYTYDRASGHYQIIATSSGSDGDNWWASMSNDGRYVVFQSDSDALDVQAGGVANGHMDIFVWDRRPCGQGDYRRHG